MAFEKKIHLGIKKNKVCIKRFAGGRYIMASFISHTLLQQHSDGPFISGWRQLLSSAYNTFQCIFRTKSRSEGPYI